MRKRIACSLDDAGALEQLDEWRTTLGPAVASADRTDASTLALRLHPGADIAAIVALARREVDCCPFFAFAVQIGADGITLVTTVPADAATILDDFATLLTP